MAVSAFVIIKTGQIQEKGLGRLSLPSMAMKTSGGEISLQFTAENRCVKQYVSNMKIGVTW